MTSITTRSEEPGEVDDTVEFPAVAAMPVLITEQQVRFATAAAEVVVSRRRPWSWLATMRTPRKPHRRHRPSRRADYMEHAAMSREMHRL
ncbi:hypothetical protein H7I41_28770 [Mycobacterium manitobense]|uniref:Uncharacterized protein n=1 Tax=[Mycobacterium] manitobense TaxID=190147 RepID=A0A9X2YUD2_9MYCO|nr:hypothetical protein [[Mycobacterium] manitobense]MCV7173919.1 hypothetical protein [[Mycobacterium] manitobense]